MHTHAIGQRAQEPHLSSHLGLILAWAVLQEYLSLALSPAVPDWTLEWLPDLVHYLLYLGLLMDVATQFCLDAVGLHPTGEGTVCVAVMLGSWLLLSIVEHSHTCCGSPPML